MNPEALLTQCPSLCGACTLACVDKVVDCPNWATGKVKVVALARIWAAGFRVFEGGAPGKGKCYRARMRVRAKLS